MSEQRTAAGIAVILARDTAGDAQSAFSLALTAAAMGDPAAIFVTQNALRWLASDEAGLEQPVLDLRAQCVEEGVRLIACSASVDHGGWSPTRFLPSVEVAGAPTFYRFACQAAVSLYI